MPGQQLTPLFWHNKIKRRFSTLTEPRQDNTTERQDRKYHIRVTGVTFWSATPEQELQDMLRYDNGIIEELTTEEKENTIVHSGRRNDTKVNIFTADIWCERFTPERWHSFGLTAMALNDVAQYNIACAFDDLQMLQRIDDEEVRT